MLWLWRTVPAIVHALACEIACMMAKNSNHVANARYLDLLFSSTWMAVTTFVSSLSSSNCTL